MQTVNIKNFETGIGKILFVDDEEALVKLWVEILTLAGYEAVGFSDPKIALAEFMKKPNSFDGVISDQIMPGLFGDALALLILKVRPDIPIFICSGYSSQINNKSIAKLGIRGFFPKPVSMVDILQALKKAINSNTAS
jgi:DNA-binding NtrC family response regulator